MGDISLSNHKTLFSVWKGNWIAVLRRILLSIFLWDKNLMRSGFSFNNLSFLKMGTSCTPQIRSMVPLLGPQYIVFK